MSEEDDRRTKRHQLRALGVALTLVGLAWVLFGLAVWWVDGR